MEYPQVVNEDSLQIWGVAANILNKQLWMASKWQSYSLEIGCGANNSSLHKIVCNERS
jgi:hypothetical protein